MTATLYDVVPVVTTGLHCGRRYCDRWWLVVSGRPRRHDGAPLRHLHFRSLQVRCLVVPVVTTGLHCGWGLGLTLGAAQTGRPRRHDGAPLRRMRWQLAQTTSHLSSPSSRRGSIAAALLRPLVAGRQRRRPRRHDGAPLRLLERGGGGIDRLVVPVVTTGLHCGCRSPVERPRPVESSPSSRRGSIAAPAARKRLDL